MKMMKYLQPVQNTDMFLVLDGDQVGCVPLDGHVTIKAKSNSKGTITKEQSFFLKKYYDCLIRVGSE